MNPPRDQLYREGYGLYRSSDATEFPADASVTVTSGALEAGHVNAVDAMVRMIDYVRFYEQQVKLMKLVSENDAASTRLMRMSG